MSNRIIRQCLFVALVSAFTCLWAGAPTSARAATPEQVEAALSRAKAFLYSQQKNGNWELVGQRDPKKVGHALEGGQFGGLTSIAVYALLASGENATDPRITQAVEFLRKADMIGVYAIGMRSQIWQFLPKTPENRAAIKKDFQLLLQGVQKKGPALGLYDYVVAPPSNRLDMSVSQYGVLGMWAAEQSGVNEVPSGYWRQVEESWLRLQQPDGGWLYDGKPTAGKKPTISMTAAGVATLFITQDYNRANEGLNCRGNIANPHIEKGMAFITANFNQALLDSRYALYGVERIGVASGYKYFGTIDWYQVGSDYLVRTQGKDGSWPGRWGLIPESSFGMLFLARGRAPVVMNKLQYGDAKAADDKSAATKTGWNQRPRDAANVTRWIGKNAERDLNWQIVNLSRPAEEFSDAPILYIAGSVAPQFSTDEMAKLRTYIENGGLILANADCGNAAFVTGMRKLAAELFPMNEFRELPAEHVIYSNQQFQRKQWRTKPSVLAVSNGVREQLLVIPQADPAKQWQTQSDKGKEELFQLMANIFLYAVDKQNLNYKGHTHLVLPAKDAKATRTLKVARLEYNGNWNPEPGGWRRLANVMLNEKKVGLTTEPVKLGSGKLSAYKVAHLTGTTKLKLDETAKSEIKQFVTTGGTLVVDASGGNPEFALAVENELRAMFAADAKGLDTPLPPEHAIYSIPDARITEVTYRTFARTKLSGETKTARLRGITIDGRVAVIYSPEDLSAGMVGNEIDGVIGYSPRTATALMRNILLYANAAK
jgi:hypothetical protein